MGEESYQLIIHMMRGVYGGVLLWGGVCEAWVVMGRKLGRRVGDRG
jgi:hypothetical protein